MSLSPKDLQCLLVYYWSADPYGQLKDMQSIGMGDLFTSVEDLIEEGLINLKGNEITAKGRFYLEYLMNTPLPVEVHTFEIPARKP